MKNLSKKSSKNVSNVSNTKETNKNVNVSNVEAKNVLNASNVDAIAKQIIKNKYNLDYANLSAKQQKEFRNKKRTKLLSYAKSIFQLQHNKDASKEDKEMLIASIKTFFKDNYTMQINASTLANDLYNTKDVQKNKDVQSVLNFIFSK